MNSIIKKFALASAIAVAFPAFAQNIVRTPVPTLPGGWQPAAALIGDWAPVADSLSTCREWAPLPETVTENKGFTQTRECDSQEKRTIQAREYNRSLKEYRLVGDPTDEFRASTVTESRDATGTKANEPGLVVLNAKPGVDGIYTVMDKKTEETFDAYVNMTDDGGNWVLAVHWVSPASASINMSVLTFRNSVLTTYTDNAAKYPVLPSGTLNGSSHALLKSEHPGWIDLYGEWQSFQMLPQGYTSSTGFPVKTPRGDSTLYSQASGWNYADYSVSSFGFWTHWGASGPCGGNGATGKSKICPTLKMGSWSSHADSTYRKFYFVKADPL